MHLTINIELMVVCFTIYYNALRMHHAFDTPLAFSIDNGYCPSIGLWGLQM